VGTLLLANAMLAFVVVAAPLIAAGAEIRYNVRRMDFLPSPSMSTARSMNEAGDVVGAFTYDSLGGGSNVAYRFTVGAGLEFLGRLGGTNSEASAINGRGETAVNSHVAGNWFTHGFLVIPGLAPLDIGTLGGQKTSIYGMNDSGQLAGDSELVGNPSYLEPNRAFRFTPEAGMEDLGTLGGSHSYARAINGRGWVAGTSALDEFGRREDAFRYTDGGGMQDLGVPAGASDSIAYGINSSGTVVGTAVFAWDYREAAMAVSNQMISLGTLLDGHSAEALDISDRGVIVGHADVIGPISVLSHGFLWSVYEGMLDLNLLVDSTNPVLADALKINNRGQVLCVAQQSQIGDFPVLLDPIPPRLSITSSPTNYVVSWSPSWSDYVLERSESPATSAWLPMPAANTNRVAVGIGAKSQFFRLRRLSDEEVQEHFAATFGEGPK